MPLNIEEHESQSPDLNQHWDTICRRRWLLALPAFGIWMAVWAVTWFLPAVYRSETVILVEQQKVPEQYVVSNVPADLQERLQSMSQQILSRTRLLRIMDEFNLYPGIRTRSNADELVARMRKDIQIELVEAPHRGDVTAFKIAYLSNDARLAQKVTAQLTSFYIDENLKARQQQSEQTTDFLDSQLEEARSNLANQEARVKEFKSHYLGELPEQVQSNLQILTGLQARLQQETDSLAQAKQRSVYLESLQNQWRSLESDLRVGRSSGTEAPPALDQELDRLRAQLADLSSHYTERHPDIRKLKEQIAKTEKTKQQMEAEVAAAAKSGSDVDEGVRPANLAEAQSMSPRMEVESQLKANRLEIENRQRSIQQVQRQIDDYQARLNTTPMREQQLAGLTRDYEQSRKSYETLLGKRDQSEMATNLEKLQKGEQFRVLDAPNLPQKPASPNRLKLSLIGLVAGVVLGIGLTAGAEMTDDRIYSKEDFQKVVTAPVLTEIPPLPTAEEEDRAERFWWLQSAALVAMALCTAAGFTVTYLFG